MACNIEIKARAHDFQKQAAIAESISDQEPQYLTHEDTFFNVPSGRLKLREFGDGTAELIQYNRPDATGPTASHYIRYPTDNPDTLKEALTKALGQRAVVRKQRTVHLTGQTRIHLDQVEHLGEFIELEVVLSPTDTTEAAIATAHELMAKLDIREEDLVEGAYVDLLESTSPKYPKHVMPA